MGPVRAHADDTHLETTTRIARSGDCTTSTALSESVRVGILGTCAFAGKDQKNRFRRKDLSLAGAPRLNRAAYANTAFRG